MADPYAGRRPRAGRAEQRRPVPAPARHRRLPGDWLRRATADVAWFWQAVVADLGIEFFEPYRTVLDASRGAPWARWFVGGTINAGPQLPGQARPLGSGGEDGAGLGGGSRGPCAGCPTARSTEQTGRLANALKRLGVGRGDRVGLFLPMMPEAVAAFLACAKIGAIVIPIFSGYGAEAVATRSTTAGRRSC
jgi:acetyl-CoA synthetase